MPEEMLGPLAEEGPDGRRLLDFLGEPAAFDEAAVAASQIRCAAGLNVPLLPMSLKKTWMIGSRKSWRQAHEGGISSPLWSEAAGMRQMRL